MEDKNLKEYSFYVEGMHCASCELLIEKKLLKQVGVESVDASLKNCQVNFIARRDAKIDKDLINQGLEPLGYKLTSKPQSTAHAKLFNIGPNGNIRISKVRFKHILRNAAIAAGLLLIFFWVESAQLGKYVSVNSGSTYSAFFLLGLAAGVSSCAALIGGLLLSLIKHWHETYIDTDKLSVRIRPHLLFHVGRLSSFFVLGGTLGVVGDAITFNNTSTYSFLVIAISVFMVVLALQMLGVTWANRISLRLPKFITRQVATNEDIDGKWMPFITGAGTFFLPCGFTLIAQGVALSTGSFIAGAFVMLFFALGTLPMLLAISASGLKFTSKPHLTAKFSHIAGIIIIFFALYNVNGQLNVLGYPSLSDIKFKTNATYKNVVAQEYVPTGEEQVVSLVAKDFNYIPTGETNFKAGVSTKLVVDNQGILGCGNFLASTGLISGFIPLDKGQNVIDLGSPLAGSYKITCSMGMVPPVLINFN